MAQDDLEQKADKSYLTSAVESLNPWAVKPATPAPTDKAEDRSTTPTMASSAEPRDHATTPFYGQSLRHYPPDCPPLKVQWFHAVDVRTHEIGRWCFAD